LSNHDPRLSQELEQDRAKRLALRLTLKQLDAIMKDTRLPGEIAGTYGVTAGVIQGSSNKRPERNGGATPA
jgi:hypothetical protein